MKIRVTIENQVFEVEINNLHTQPILATVDGQTYEVWTEKKSSETSETKDEVTTTISRQPVKPALASAPRHYNGSSGSSPSNAVVAPIPGVIVAIAIQPNTTVTAGQELCTLETMKMKNLIRAPYDGQIASIQITVGEHVKQRQVLMEYAAS